MQWILNGPALQTFTTQPDAVRFFSGKTTYVVARQGNEVSTPAAWDARSTRIFTSCADLERAFASGRVGPDVKAILYDNEHWKFTPDEEQRNFGDYSRRCADIAHQHGKAFINAPAVTLTRSMSNEQGPRYELYLRLNIAADAARNADIYEIQAQGSEMNAGKFANFVSAAAQQARSANPHVLVFAGLSTAPNGQQVSSQQLLAAVQATRNVVDGYWLNVPAPSAFCPSCQEFAPDKALEFLRGFTP